MNDNTTTEKNDTTKQTITDTKTFFNLLSYASQWLDQHQGLQCVDATREEIDDAGRKGNAAASIIADIWTDGDKKKAAELIWGFQEAARRDFIYYPPKPTSVPFLDIEDDIPPLRLSK